MTGSSHMRRGVLNTLALLAAASLSACGSDDSESSTRGLDRSETGQSLPCAKAEQLLTALDIPGPGQPTPEDAVAPYAGGLFLAAERVDGRTIVLGLRRDGTVFREYQVRKRSDGWWPDGYRECSA